MEQNLYGEMPVNRDPQIDPAYDGVCVGHYIQEYVKDAITFNQNIESGMPFEEALRRDKEKGQGDPFSYNRFYILYEYDVAGYHFIRASEKASHSKGKYWYIRERCQHPHTIYYQRNYPFHSEIGHRVDEKEGAGEDGIKGFVFGILSMLLPCTVIGSIILGILGLKYSLQAKRKNTETMAFPICGIIFSIVGLVGSVMLLLVGIVLIVGGMLSGMI